MYIIYIYIYIYYDNYIGLFITNTLNTNTSRKCTQIIKKNKR